MSNRILQQEAMVLNWPFQGAGQSYGEDFGVCDVCEDGTVYQQRWFRQGRSNVSRPDWTGTLVIFSLPLWEIGEAWSLGWAVNDGI